ncbi:hypothetical protein V6Z11_D09G062700 [Gossypium hirsutum]
MITHYWRPHNHTSRTSPSIKPPANHRHSSFTIIVFGSIWMQNQPWFPHFYARNLLLLTSSPRTEINPLNLRVKLVFFPLDCFAIIGWFRLSH